MRTISFLLLSIIYVNISIGATLTPKYKCIGGGQEIEIFVSENYLCGNPGVDYQAAAVLKEIDLPMLDAVATGIISISKKGIITAKSYDFVDGKKYLINELTFSEMENGKANLKTISDIENGQAQYINLPLKCKSTVQYHMDCEGLE